MVVIPERVAPHGGAQGVGTVTIPLGESLDRRGDSVALARRGDHFSIVLPILDIRTTVIPSKSLMSCLTPTNSIGSALPVDLNCSS